MDETLFGYIFASYALAVMVGSLIVGRILTKVGRKAVLLSGLLLMSVTMIGFGLIAYIHNPTLLISVSLMLRLLQGLSSSMIQTTSYSIVVVSYGKDSQKFLGILEAATGFGLVAGAFCGSLLYSFFGYKMTFVTIGSVFMLNLPVLQFSIPQSVDMHDDTEPLSNNTTSEVVDMEEGKSKTKSISYIDILQRPVFVCLAVASGLSYFQY